MTALSFALKKAGGAGRKLVHPDTRATLYLHEPHPEKTLKEYQVRDMISYGGTTVRQLEKNFRDAVDEYLAMREETGEVPDKPFKGSFNVRIPQELHLRAARFAEENDRKLNGVVTEALSAYLEKSA